jgi:hypothetical protein
MSARVMIYCSVLSAVGLLVNQLLSIVKLVLTDNWRHFVGLAYNGASTCMGDCFSQKSFLCNSPYNLIKPVLTAFLSVEILKLDFLSSCFDINCFNFISSNILQPQMLNMFIIIQILWYFLKALFLMSLYVIYYWMVT